MNLPEAYLPMRLLCPGKGAGDKGLIIYLEWQIVVDVGVERCICGMKRNIRSVTTIKIFNRAQRFLERFRCMEGFQKAEKAAVEGFERVKEIKRELTSGKYMINPDFIEAKSLATIAYLILKEVI